MMLAAERLAVEDDAEAISDLYYRMGWTDGLPIIPPTPARVERMLAGCGEEPDRCIGLVPPGNGEATLEAMAINAVMAGCLPAYLPALVAAMEAMLDPSFNLNGVQCTTSSTTPLLLFNGPIRRRLEINCVGNAFGQGRRSNAAIGRAIRLILTNIGGATPGDVDKASLGHPGKYSFCFGENEEESPWEPFHRENGYPEQESTVTAIGVTGSIEVKDRTSRSGEGVLKTMAGSLTSASIIGTNNAFDGGQLLLVFTPEHARRIAAAGYSKPAAREWIWREVRMSLEEFPPEKARSIAEWKRRMGLPEDGLARVTRRPEDILVVVAGGAGVKSAFVAPWIGSRAVTRPVRRVGNGE